MNLQLQIKSIRRMSRSFLLHKVPLIASQVSTHPSEFYIVLVDAGLLWEHQGHLEPDGGELYLGALRVVLLAED